MSRSNAETRLERYRQKRDFRVTTEPQGANASAAPDDAQSGRYVMHHHAARNDHFDLRLEQNGVLRSWALPRGPSMAPGEKRLAVEVEDHPLEYGDFEGVIPAGEYGGGTVMLWDAGHWICHQQSESRIDLALHGNKLRGRWTLTRMRDKGKRKQNQWLFIKRSDDDGPLPEPDDRSIASGRTMAEIAADHDREWAGPQPMPDVAKLPGARRAAWPGTLTPQLATLADNLPDGDWLHEIKLDGYRILVHLEQGRVQLMTRNGQDWRDRFPALARQLAAWPVQSAILDGEIVALQADGVTSFAKLQQALAEQRTDALIYHAFDLLYLNGTSLTHCTNLARKQALADVMSALGDMPGGRVRYTDHLHGDGAPLLDRLCELGLEGLIAKRADSTYQQRRTRSWLKLKCARHDEFVVGGFTPPNGQRDAFGALLLGAWNAQGQFVYAGRVGTGFSRKQLKSLHTRLSKFQIPKSPFLATPPDSKGATWVTPALVVEVAYAERTRDGVLRHPSFRGVREDRNAGGIMMTHPERSTATPATAGRRSAPARRKTENAEVEGVRLTHPDRVLYPQQGMTKLALAQFYQSIAAVVLPGLIGRPLSLLRCPEGLATECFFQKHPRQMLAERVPRIHIKGKTSAGDYVYVQELADLIALVQAGVMELHPWGSRVDDLEHPDQLVFDLDPDEGISWRRTVAVAHQMAERLTDLELTPFVRTTGGKGLHIVVPLVPRAGWDDSKAFARALCQRMADDQPTQLTTNLLKAKRRGRIFLDYLRNGRGATAVASYTVRARPGAPVAVPIRWDELTVAMAPDRYTVDNLRRRLAALKQEPWAGFDKARQPLTATLLRAVGATPS
ncbi:DNA ligase D [Alcanivorax quisquiliarum]|uniref:DNA ligase (ATP) n=1 Tax=Alcanivorax quisquiliarum TaxID=2933565 RepID=A0ABT0E8B2_9GAMM|nr:DNA ligase D [Alcanivorax quisquiliarum]MCK0538005.1 DNA ligase D [Alcanivorax quisquiliarum]